MHSSDPQWNKLLNLYINQHFYAPDKHDVGFT